MHIGHAMPPIGFKALGNHMTFVLCPHTKIGALILGIESVYDIHKIYHENICMDIYPLLYVLTV